MNTRLISAVVMLIIIGVVGFVYFKDSGNGNPVITNPDYNPSYADAIQQKNHELCSYITYALKYQGNPDMGKIYGESAVKECESQVKRGYIGCNCHEPRLFDEMKMTEARAALDVSAELKSATIVKIKTNTELENYVKADLVIYNNSDKTIGFDPNDCDYETYINEEKLELTHACTAIGGVIELLPGKTREQKITIFAPHAKEDDTVYFDYGYMLLLPEYRGNGYSYSYFDSDFVKSNALTIK